MIDFSRAALTHFSVHQVGNKGLGESLTCSEKPFEIQDEFVKDTLLRYFLGPFKTDIYHQFTGKGDLAGETVRTCCERLFKDRNTFMAVSKEFAAMLYNQSMHPKIKGGEFFVCYFRDAMVDGVVCDAIGLFKTENKETYLRVFEHMGEFGIESETGIDINRLDKGALIFNTDSKKGFKLSVIDQNNRIAECAQYWESDFLAARLKENAYYHTKNFMEASRGFCEEVLTEANNVTKPDQMMMLNRSTSYFKDKEKFNMPEFEQQVLVEPELINAFRGYREDFNKRLDLTAVDDFEVSQTAVKKNQRFMRSVVKLDKNFHIYIHSRHDYVERGYDEDKGLKYYKLFYVNETFAD